MTQPLDNSPKPSISHRDAGPASDPSPAGGALRQDTKFFSPPPSMATPEAATSGIGKYQAVSMAVAAASVLVIVAGIGLATRQSPPPQPPAPAMAATQPAAPTKTLFVSAADRDDKATDQWKAFMAATDASADKLTASAKDLNAENAETLLKAESAAPQLAADLQADRMRLYRVYLLDFLDQDGDRVELFLDGISFGNIDLKNEGASVLFPVSAGRPLQVKLVATGDGGGGVTVAFISSVGEARTSVMQVGQFEQWQVVVQ